MVYQESLSIFTRALLQDPASVFNTGSPLSCYPSAVCLAFNIVVACTILLVILIIILIVLYKRFRYLRAIRRGSIPARMVINSLGARPSEVGDVESFSFKVSRPKTREEVNEESCPICLGTKPKAKSWLVFSTCKHATCISCFRKLVSRQKLQSACPICRSLLAEGEGSRGGPDNKDQESEAAAHTQSPDQQQQQQQQQQEQSNDPPIDAATSAADPAVVTAENNV